MGTKNSKLSSEQVEELQKYTKFEKKELAAWYKGFIKESPSGQIDKEQFQSMYKKFFPFGDPSSYSSLAFKSFDLNNNGFIDFKEFIIALSLSTKGTFNDKIIWAFQLYDLDNDGYITKDEMEIVVESVYRMLGSVIKLNDDDSPFKRTEKLFQLMDKNLDGKITFQEFKEAAQQQPSIVNSMSLYEGIV